MPTPGARQCAYHDPTPNPQAWLDPWSVWHEGLTLPGTVRNVPAATMEARGGRPPLQNLDASIGMGSQLNRQADIELRAMRIDPRLSQNRSKTDGG